MVDCSFASRPYVGLPQNTADDRERARELYKYFRPPVAAEPIDTVLTAHAQLTAWRLNAERAMISLIDEETQYFVAESTKTVHLDDAAQYDNPEDAIWAGCVRVPKAGRLCEHTISTLPPPEGGPALFEVLDLSKDERFDQLSFIAGPPHFRYYAGVPLRTSCGINIGSLYVLDSKVRPALTRNEKGFLGVMADNVMQHLEMTRDKKDRRRTFRMNECLSAYVDPTPENAKNRRRYSHHSESESIDPDSDADSRRTADGSERIEVITRAAELLREAVDIEEGGGGVLFLDTSLAAVPSQHPFLGDDHTNENTTAEGSRRKDLRQPNQPLDGSDSPTTTKPSTRSSSPEIRRKRNGSTEVLAHTYRSVSKSPDQPEFTSFTPEELLKIIKRYPRGKMFTFDHEGQELSDASDNGSVLSGRPNSRRRRERASADFANLHACFPKARQIMFIPLWDSTTSRSAACFVYNCSEYRNFSHNLEFLHCITFNNCVDTELLRLANSKANEQKSDFIGSISHELRSPLHGILASCEFLQDTTCTSFQQSLVNTAESCARTLLDTVNMVLDYSKINAFEKSKPGSAMPALADEIRSEPSDALQTNLSAHRNIDLAVLIEEVVEGVAVGHAFSDLQNRALRHETGDIRSRISTSSDLTKLSPCKPDVELIVEISEQNWTYWCEPGSLRRIVMNLVGNSLKYTKAGFVHVKLETQTSEADANEYCVLAVIDSGQGISPAYLRDKLFTPFAQESNQAPGIGLGLSLVKSIVGKLGGHIDIESTVGVGTKATVSIPLVRNPASGSRIGSAVNSNSPEVSNSSADENSSMRQIMTQASGKSVAVYWHEGGEGTSIQQEASRLMRESLTAYLSAWCGVSVSQWHKDSPVDIIVVEEAGLDSLLRESPQLSAPDCQTMIMVLRSTGSVQNRKADVISHNIEDIRRPFGPHKLARALQACLDRSHSEDTDLANNDITEDLGKSPIDSITAAAGDLSISGVVPASFQAPIVIQDSLDLYQDQSKSNSNLLPSDPGSTTTRSVSLSAKLTDSDENQITPTPTKAPSVINSAAKLTPVLNPDPSNPSHRVLLVDDNAINLRLLQVGMKKRGYTSISSASDGLQAVNTYRTLLYSPPSSPPDIILMDLSMPIMNGFEATRQIREIEAEYNARLQEGGLAHHSLIIALTGLASVTDQKKAYTAGVDSYIMKPVSLAKLTKLLEDWSVDGRASVEVVVPDTAVVAR
ncbi:hypothetical protein BU25DRAFT_362458 [Macroventuria anomochaeta]|uniref:Uncharacterized protein n=1 Tax=Macroventuria anomochaeta TaxID=301207 RepID=A0ACB6SB60_9PLEO|nr:uncharacterized protein BU25DRAFT_362458 [Macroventuria anomochaeta]KAF2630337.1 hypothetical protein BU25DRAFT_362458 [Macroventuria anomochaeta]